MGADKFLLLHSWEFKNSSSLVFVCGKICPGPQFAISGGKMSQEKSKTMHMEIFERQRCIIGFVEIQNTKKLKMFKNFLLPELVY